MSKISSPSTGALARRLRDIEDIKLLKAAYFRCVDGRDWTGLRALLTDDCDFVSRGMREVVGPDSFVSRVAELIHPGVSVHHGHMPEITITGANSAQGIWAMVDYVEVDGHDGSRRGLVGFGHYFEDYRRTREGWRFSRWELRRTRIERLGRGGEGLLSLAGIQSASAPQQKSRSTT